MPAIYHEGSWLGNATDPEVLVKDTVGWTGKNLLKNTFTGQYTINGITFTFNADKSVTVNGTATGNANFILYKVGASFPIGNFILSNGGIFNFQCYLNCKSGDTIVHNYQTQGKLEQEVIIDYANYDNLVFGLWVPSGTTVSNVTCYPMIRRADITDPTYEPYHESVEEEIEQIYADNGVLGAKNLLPYPYADTTKTENGITFTDNGDGTVTIGAGTATGNAFFVFANASKNIKIGKGQYVISGGVSNSIVFYFQLSSSDAVDTGNGAHFSLDSDYTFVSGKAAYIRVISGTVISSPVTIKPMLRLASDPDDTYQPYAMTNRELTEKKINIADLKTVVSASSDFTDFKTRIASL